MVFEELELGQYLDDGGLNCRWVKYEQPMVRFFATVYSDYEKMEDSLSRA